MFKKSILVIFYIFLLSGCASVSEVKPEKIEFILMPKEVALQVVQKYYPDSDAEKILVRGIDTCKNQSNRVKYDEIDALFHMKFSSIPSTSTAYAKWNYWGFCNLGARASGLSDAQAIELAAALNSLGAKIPTVTISVSKVL